MFKNILSEIHRQKKLMNLMEEEKSIKSVIFGDNVIDNLDKKNFEEIPQLVGNNLKIKDLISKLKTVEEKPDIDHVFFSVGKGDKFENEDLIDVLSFRLRKVFPNANINVIRPILNDKDFNNLNTDVLPNENKVRKFYDEFKINNIEVVGDYDILDSTKEDQKIRSLETELLNRIVLDVYKDNNVTTNVQNVDIFGEDETDFDTIYEFINRFEDIVKSNNEYKKNMTSSFKPDIEQIQIVLKFLNQDNDGLEITGEVDTATEEAIEDFQRSNNLEVTGIADNETLDELLYELKAKGFDELDLAKYIQNLDISGGVKIDSGVVSYDKTSDSDKPYKAAAAAVGVGVAGGVILNLSNSKTEVDYNKLLSDLKTLGLSDSAAKGLVSNAYGESNLNSKAKGDSGSYAANNKNSINIDGKRYCSFGLWQYNICGGMGNSYLQKHGVDPSSPDSQKKIDILFDYKKQVEFMADRIRKEQQRGDKSVGEWIDWIVDNVERPSDKSGAKSKRRSYASARGWL